MFCSLSFFFFNDTATTEIYTLSLHDALPISRGRGGRLRHRTDARHRRRMDRAMIKRFHALYVGQIELENIGSKRSEEHTSELQSPCNLVCRLLLEKKKTKKTQQAAPTHETRT